MQTILIIDDDTAIGDLEQEVLERAGYAVQRAYSGTEALLLLKSSRPDLILLDLMLPGLSGEEVLPRIQGIPVIVISAKTAVQDKVDLLLGGAADYLTKPFDTKELLARVAVRLREAARSSLAAVYTCGSLTLDTASHEVRTGDVQVQLTRTEYAILKLLMQNSGQVLARVLDHLGAEYRVVDDAKVDVFADVQVTKLAVEALKENCVIYSMKERDESLESFYMNLIGGAHHV